MGIRIDDPDRVTVYFCISGLEFQVCTSRCVHLHLCKKEKMSVLYIKLSTLSTCSATHCSVPVPVPVLSEHSLFVLSYAGPTLQDCDAPPLVAHALHLLHARDITRTVTLSRNPTWAISSFLFIFFIAWASSIPFDQVCRHRRISLDCKSTS